MFNNSPWLNASYQQLVEPILQRRAHHALLINYIQGSGENELLTLFIKRLLCAHPDQALPCNHCHSCQLVAADNHPDYHIIAAEKNKHSIGVDQIRAVANKIYEKAQQGGNKVIWLQYASSMTEAASNALLKTLEEPPENTYFILSAAHDSKFLPTIYSRCSYFFIAVPTLEDSIAWLKPHYPQYNDNELATALLLSENAPLAALLLLQAEKWSQRQEFCGNLLTQIAQNDYWSLGRDFNHDLIMERINWFSSLLSDALKARQKAGYFIVNRDQVPLVRLLAAQGHERIISLYDLWLVARQNLLTVSGLNKELIIYNLLAQSEMSDC